MNKKILITTILFLSIVLMSCPTPEGLNLDNSGPVDNNENPNDNQPNTNMPDMVDTKDYLITDPGFSSTYEITYPDNYSGDRYDTISVTFQGRVINQDEQHFFVTNEDRRLASYFIEKSSDGIRHRGGSGELLSSTLFQKLILPYSISTKEQTVFNVDDDWIGSGDYLLDYYTEYTVSDKTFHDCIKLTFPSTRLNFTEQLGHGYLLLSRGGSLVYYEATFDSDEEMGLTGEKISYTQTSNTELEVRTLTMRILNGNNGNSPAESAFIDFNHGYGPAIITDSDGVITTPLYLPDNHILGNIFIYLTRNSYEQGEYKMEYTPESGYPVTGDIDLGDITYMRPTMSSVTTSLNPPNTSVDINPSELTKLTVTFSEDMTQGGYSIVHPNLEGYERVNIGQIEWLSPTEIDIYVDLDYGTDYAIMLNSPIYLNFRDSYDNPLEPVLWTFSTVEMDPADLDITTPTRLLYTSEGARGIFELDETTGGNDEVVEGFDHSGNIHSSFYQNGSFFYLTSVDHDDYRVFKMNSGYNDDEEIGGFDYIDWDSSIYYVNNEWYYSCHRESPGLGLYRMVVGSDNDEEIQGIDKELGQNSNGPYFYHDGTDWFYSVNTSWPDYTINRLVGDEENGTGNNDVELTGFDDLGSLILAPVTSNPGEIWYSGGGDWFIYNDNGTEDDEVIEGFDNNPNGRQILSDGTDIYYIHNGDLYKKLDGVLDDQLYEHYDNVDNNYNRSVFVDGTSVYYSGNSTYQILPGSDTEITGFDETGNNNTTVIDGEDIYYLQHDFNTGERVIYKKVGTEENDTLSNDILITGMDSSFYGGYAFCVIDGEIYYQDYRTVKKIVGDEENFTGNNDEEVFSTHDNSRIVHFVYYDGYFYYADSENSIYIYLESGSDIKIFDGSKVDRDITTFALLP